MASVFVTGGTGYIGRPLLEALLARSHAVHALVRGGAERRLPSGVVTVVGDALDAASFVARIPERATIVHLVGTPHPNPSKAAEFERVDLGSVRATTTAAHAKRGRRTSYTSASRIRRPSCTPTSPRACRGSRW